MHCEGWLLTRTLVLAVPNYADSQSRHHVRKPMCSRTSRRKGQSTVSKAFAKLTFSSTVGWCEACSQRQVSYMGQKFSCNCHPRMKADWLILTILVMYGAR